MKDKRTYTGHRVYLRNRARLKQATDTCALCGQHIPEDADPLDPDAFTADHITPVSLGGTHALSNLRAAHRRCNIQRGNGRRRKKAEPPNLGRTW